MADSAGMQAQAKPAAASGRSNCPPPLPPLEQVCFVCAGDDGELLSNVCSCRSLVHLHCQRKLVSQLPSYSNGQCAVCLRRYRNARRNWLPKVAGCLYSLLAVGLPFMGVAAILLATALRQSAAEFANGTEYSLQDAVDGSYASRMAGLYESGPGLFSLHSHAHASLRNRNEQNAAAPGQPAVAFASNDWGLVSLAGCRNSTARGVPPHGCSGEPAARDAAHDAARDAATLASALDSAVATSGNESLGQAVSLQPPPVGSDASVDRLHQAPSHNITMVADRSTEQHAADAVGSGEDSNVTGAASHAGAASASAGSLPVRAQVAASSGVSNSSGGSAQDDDGLQFKAGMYRYSLESRRAGVSRHAFAAVTAILLLTVCLVMVQIMASGPQVVLTRRGTGVTFVRKSATGQMRPVDADAEHNSMSIIARASAGAESLWLRFSGAWACCRPSTGPAELV